MFLAGVNTDLLLDTSMECFQNFPGFLGFDHGIDIAFRGGYVRVGEFLTILGNFDFTHFFRIFGSHNLFFEDDVGSTFRSHYCNGSAVGHADMKSAFVT